VDTILPSTEALTATLGNTGLPTPMFVGLYDSQSGKSELRSVEGWDAFNSAGNKLAQQGMRLISIDTIEDNGTTYYTGV
jgi:hypothetical protein